MKKHKFIFICCIYAIALIFSCKKSESTITEEPQQASVDMIINNTCTKLASIPATCIEKAKTTLHIAYGHTSHGSQLITGMQGLVSFKGNLYAFNSGGTNGALDIRDYFVAGDLGNPDRSTWASRTRDYLKQNSNINVVMWSWCGQVSTATENDINNYLSLMTGLENEFKNVKFVYMTGHLDGTGVNGNLHKRNEQIRKYCKDNKKILYDFAMIESYDPDGNFYLDKNANDNCDYYKPGSQTTSNWALDWQNSHTKGVDWYQCSAVHSQCLNGNLKAYSAWWLFARLAGWNGN